MDALRENPEKLVVDRVSRPFIWPTLLVLVLFKNIAGSFSRMF